MSPAVRQTVQTAHHLYVCGQCGVVLCLLHICTGEMYPTHSALSSLHFLQTTTFTQTQLFFPFHPRNFDSSIAHLQTACFSFFFFIFVSGYVC